MPERSRFVPLGPPRRSAAWQLAQLASYRDLPRARTSWRRELARELRESTAPASSLSTSLSGLPSAALPGVASASVWRRRLLSRWLRLRRWRGALGKYEGGAAADRENDRRNQSDVSSHGFRNPPDGSGAPPARIELSRRMPATRARTDGHRRFLAITTLECVSITGIRRSSSITTKYQNPSAR